MASESLQGEKQLHFKYYFYKCFIPMKSAPQKLEFLMVRAISKSYTLDCSCKSPCAFTHRYA